MLITFLSNSIVYISVTYTRNKIGTFKKGTEQPYGFSNGHKPWNKDILKIKICPQCNKKFTGQTKYCCKECWNKTLKNRTGKNNPNWKNGRSKDSKILRERSRICARNKKEKLENILGGKCVICGYDKYSGALELHHKDPSTKEAKNVQQYWNLYKSKGESAIIERFILLCSNCHKELHGGKI